MLLVQPLLPAHQSCSFDVTNLVSDLPGVAAHTDPRLLNPWGLVFNSKGNLVVANNHSDSATSYSPKGRILDFAINVSSSPTGVERNHNSRDFHFGIGGVVKHAQYLFSTEEGTILAFNCEVDPNNAVVVIDRSSFDSIYKGLALAKIDGKQYLFATDFHNGQVDVFDSQFNFVFSFTDTTLPKRYASFNIRNFDGRLYVTFARQKPGKEDDQAGPGHGFVDIFQPIGRFGEAFNFQWLSQFPLGA